jgi:hypothetical protein
MSEELAKYEGGAIDLVKDPERVLTEAKKAAEALVRVVSGKPKKVIINDEQYLEFEDWQTLGRFYGLTAKVESTSPVNFEGVRGWESHAVVRNREGEIISAADAMCLNDEEKWSTRAKYEYPYVLKDGTKAADPPKEQITWIPNPKKSGKSMPKRERVRVADEAVPFFQLRSMAQTRACAKAFRNVLAWVVVLAGYKPTPAEEMPGNGDEVHGGEEISSPTDIPDFQPHPLPKPPQKAPEDKKAHQGQYAGSLISIQEKVNNKKDSPNFEKPYWSIKHAYGDAWTYDPDLAQLAIDAVKTDSQMVWELTPKGQMINLKIATMKP